MPLHLSRLSLSEYVLLRGLTEDGRGVNVLVPQFSSSQQLTAAIKQTGQDWMKAVSLLEGNAWLEPVKSVADVDSSPNQPATAAAIGSLMSIRTTP